LGIKYTSQEKEVFNRFLSGFVSFEEEDIEYYEFNQILTALFLLSKSSQREKAQGLFDIFDADFNDSLSQFEAEYAFSRICDVVFTYSEKILDNEESMVALHQEIMNKKVDSSVLT